jgi:hypothetical protein
LFAFKRKDPLEQLEAVVIKVAAKFYVLKIEPPLPGLSNEAQFLYDELNHIDPAALEAYENRADASETHLNAETRVRIENLKRQLSQMGVNVKWLEKEKRYVVV